MQTKTKNENNRTRNAGLILSAPEDLSATCGDVSGDIDLAWEPVLNAYSYLIQKCTGSSKPFHWVNLDIVTKSSYTVTKLKRGRKYRFRVAAISREGQSKWSNPVQKKAP